MHELSQATRPERSALGKRAKTAAREVLGRHRVGAVGQRDVPRQRCQAERQRDRLLRDGHQVLRKREGGCGVRRQSRARARRASRGARTWDDR